jgi:DNA anti-recombination protein RmuC
VSESITHTITKHPALIIGGGAALALAYFVFGNKGATSAASNAGVNQAAAIQAYNQQALQVAQLQQQSQALQTQSALQNAQLQAQVSIAQQQNATANLVAQGNAIGTVTNSMTGFLSQYDQPFINSVNQAGAENTAVINAAAASQIEGLNALSNTSVALGNAVQGLGGALASVTNSSNQTNAQNTASNAKTAQTLIGGLLKFGVSGGIG